jgi:hypothetical protein
LGGSENSGARFVAEEVEVWIAAQMSAREARARRYGMLKAEKV